MADPFGLYDKLLNTVYGNYSDWMREDAVYMLFKAYDGVWHPKFQSIYPRTAAPSVNGRTVSVETDYTIPNIVDPQTMARHYSFWEMPDVRGVAMSRETMQAKMAKEWGPTTHPLEFPSQFKTGILEKRNQMLLQNAFKSLSRFVEYRLVNYTRGVEAVMNDYGNQYAKQGARQIKFDAMQTTSTASDYLGGKRWNEPNADVLSQLTDMNLNFNEFAGEDLTQGYVGANTSAGLEKNTAIYDLVKNHYDATQTRIARTLKGVTMTNIVGQTYKDDTLNSTQVGYPGRGDVRQDTRAVRRKIKMMTHTEGGTEYEWGLFLNGPIGLTFTASCFPDHKDSNVPYSNSWTDPRTKAEHSEVCLGFNPYIHDMAKYIIVDRLSTIKV